MPAMTLVVDGKLDVATIVVDVGSGSLVLGQANMPQLRLLLLPLVLPLLLPMLLLASKSYVVLTATFVCRRNRRPSWLRSCTAPSGAIHHICIGGHGSQHPPVAPSDMGLVKQSWHWPWTLLLEPTGHISACLAATYATMEPPK